MKKFVISLFLSVFCILSIQKSEALTYKQALESSKPMAVLVYADWADNADTVKQAFSGMESKYGTTYNFVPLNIASDDTKLFNKKYHIYPNLPYVLLFKDNGKISRYLQQNCIMDSSCFSEKLDFFNN